MCVKIKVGKVTKKGEKNMKVMKQFTYTGKYQEKEYKKTMLVCGDAEHYPRMYGIPYTEENLTGADVELTYAKYGEKYKTNGVRKI